MEAPGRRADRSLEQNLFDHGYDFGFFQAVRLLTRFSEERAPVGGTGSPSSEVVRFHARQSLAFPPSAIFEISKSSKDQPEMTVAFLGLTGPQGTLPLYYTEEVINRSSKKDGATEAFFDLFNHRLLSLFYRAWEKHHFIVAFEREKAAPATFMREGVTQFLFDLIGMGTDGLRNRLLIEDEALLLYAGLLAQRPHSASALTGLLRDYFRVPVEIEQFRGKWFPLAEDVLSYLHPQGSHNELGFGAIMGDAVWNPQARFRLRLGPLSYNRFAAFLPGERALEELTELVQYFAGPALQFDVQLILRAEEVPACLLADQVTEEDAYVQAYIQATGQEGGSASSRACVGRGQQPPPRLGLTSWLTSESIPDDAWDVILEGVPRAA